MPSTSWKRRARRSRCSAIASAKLSARPERISISEAISSPAADSASTSSRRQAAWTSSKRCSSSSVAGSRIANSSSSPTVKSVEDSNVSRARSRSRDKGQLLSQVEVERVEQVNRGTRGVDRHLRRHLQQLLGVVEDDLDAGLDEAIGHGLCGGGGHGEHADDDLLLGDDLLQLAEVADPQAADL